MADKDYYTKEEMNNLFYQNEEVDDLLNKKQDVLNDDLDSPEQNLKRINNQSLIGKGSINVLTEHQSLDNYYTKSESNSIIRVALRSISTYSIEFTLNLPLKPSTNVIYAVISPSLEGMAALNLWTGEKWVRLGNIIESSLNEYARNAEVELLLNKKQDLLVDEGVSQNFKKLNINGESISLLGDGEDVYIPVFEQVQADWEAEELLPDGSSNPAYIHNKPIIPSKTSELFNNGYFATQNQLNTSYYTKEVADNRIDEKIKAVKGFHPEIVEAEPESPLENQLYLLKNKDTGNYDILVYIKESESATELKKIKLGTSNTNYDDYLLKDDFESKINNMVVKELVTGSTDRYKVLSSNDFTDQDRDFLLYDIDNYLYDDTEIKKSLSEKQLISNMTQNISADTASTEKYPSVAAAASFVQEYLQNKITELSADEAEYPLTTDKNKVLISKELINNIISKLLKTFKKEYNTIGLRDVPTLIDTLPNLDDFSLLKTNLKITQEETREEQYNFNAHLTTHWDNGLKYNTQGMEGVLTGAEIIFSNDNDVIGTGKTDENGNVKLTVPKTKALGNVYAQYATPGIFKVAVSNDLYINPVIHFVGDKLTIPATDLFSSENSIQLFCEGKITEYDPKKPLVVEAQDLEKIYHEVYIVSDPKVIAFNEKSFAAEQNNISKIILADDLIVHKCFQNMQGIVEVILPDTIYDIHEGAFEGSTIEKVKIPSKLEKLEKGVFMDCKSLAEVIFSNRMNQDFEIHDACFVHCNMSEVVLPENCVSVGQEAFSNCLNLEKVSFGEELNYLGQGAFAGCSKLKDIQFYGLTPPRMANYVFDAIDEDCVITVPSAALSKYIQLFNEKGYDYKVIGG